MKAVGKIEYLHSGETIVYDDAKEYLQAYKEALREFGVAGGFKATTITQDPETRKAVDDLIYGEFGEENPNDLEHYQKKYSPVAEEVQTQETKIFGERVENDVELRAGQKFFDPDLDKMLKREFSGRFDHPEEYTQEDWEELCNKEPPKGIITITQRNIDQGEIDVGLEFLTIEEFRKRVKDGYYLPIPENQSLERETALELSEELDGEELEI